MLWVVAVGFFMQTLDSTIVNTALPSMARSLGESPLRMQSVIIAYSLTMAVIIPASGWLADRFGTRTIFQTAIGLFVAGSLLCAGRHAADADRGARGAGRGRRDAAAGGAAVRAAHLSARTVSAGAELSSPSRA
jgi:MFS family permease